MVKSLRILLTLALAALLLPACTRKQGPTPSDNPMGSRNAGLGGDIIPSMDTTGWTPDLEVRGTSSMGDGYYTDSTGKQWRMVEGLLPSVYFGFDSASIAGSERGKLQQAADQLMQNPGNKILIEGHCDWYGTAEYNLALGDRRALSASDYLVTLGVSPSRIETLSKGSLEATSGLSKSDSSQDRRADLIILE
ncbi:OmpA family protein [Coraliomargarita parva]|uniref:OmpA family protein n=1 Tax=Coraliomargarita parva TaxID=3014050 RepID=UPI0022B56852|nr:OmpA family protein [Coraliomargarita parva]